MARVAVLIPSRMRPEQLGEAITSLRETAADPDAVDIIVRTDDDDDPYPVAPHLAGQQDRHLVGPRVGMNGMATMVREMIAATEAEWLLIWNDDARMTMAGWDSHLAEFDPQALHVVTYGSDHSGNSFPVISRAFFVAVDLCDHPAVDTYWCEVADALGCHRTIPWPAGPIVHDQRLDAVRYEGIRRPTWDMGVVERAVARVRAAAGEEQ